MLLLQAQKYIDESKDKAKKANDLHAQIQARLANISANMPGLPTPMKGMPPVKPDKIMETQV